MCISVSLKWLKVNRLQLWDIWVPSVLSLSRVQSPTRKGRRKAFARTSSWAILTAEFFTRSKTIFALSKMAECVVTSAAQKAWLFALLKKIQFLSRVSAHVQDLRVEPMRMTCFLKMQIQNKEGTRQRDAGQQKSERQAYTQRRTQNFWLGDPDCKIRGAMDDMAVSFLYLKHHKWP